LGSGLVSCGFSLPVSCHKNLGGGKEIRGVEGGAPPSAAMDRIRNVIVSLSVFVQSLGPASAIMRSAVMDWLSLRRKPEPEVMSEADAVEAYASAAAQTYLDSIDNTLVEQVLRVSSENGLGSETSPLRGALLDVGTGPGGIPLKLVRRCPDLRAVGVDRSLNMVRAARQAAAQQGLAGRTFFFQADAGRLGLRDAGFDLVLSNSLLHHLPDAVAAFNEMARVAKPSGVVLLRDLRRPSWLLFPLHVSWFGRYYSGLMKKLYIDSVRAAYTGGELAALLRRSRLADARVFFHGRTHLGFVRSGTRAET
jgi:SAM-dependent methyltransferase